MWVSKTLAIPQMSARMTGKLSLCHLQLIRGYNECAKIC